MATAVEERTRKLEQSAEVLERREADIRFERDRLHTVIRSMEDGLFILDAAGNITLSNVAARPVIEAPADSKGDKSTKICRKNQGQAENCLHCIADFSHDVQGCTVDVGPRIYEIKGAVLSGPRVAAGANAVILLGAVVVNLAGSAEVSVFGGNVSFQFTFFVFFALLLLVWRGSGPLSLDHLFRIDEEREPDLFHET